MGRPAHGAMLKASLEKAELDGAARRSAAGITVHGAAPGLYVQFESRPGVTLNVSSLEDRKVGIEVVAVTREAVGEGEYGPSVERATVFVPDGQVKHFVSKFEAYASTTPKAKGDHRHEDMLDRVSDLRLATLRALWTDSPAAYPADDLTVWWEVWLRRTDGRELERLHEFAVHANLNVGPRRLEFDDRIVVLVRAAPRALAACIDVLNDFAELRATKELASFFVDIDAVEQAAWSDDLLRRVRPPSTDIAVCVLDTGVTRGHPLLAPAIAEGDVYAINPEWGAADDGGGPGNAGHGTEMAGLALYGDLAAALASSAAVHLTHRVESVKILPPKRFGSNDPEMYGTITALGVSYPEAATANRRRVFSLAVTATDERDRGQPTSWSAAIDALAAGRMFDQTKQGLVYLDDDSSHSRLFVVSAGNVEVLEPAHLDRSDTEPVHDPAHAWNALTVGAYTERAELDDSMQPSWTAVARPGDLSPWSTTSVTFGTGWPIKPDVVAEGGNVAEDGHGSVTFGIASLSLLTTYCKPAEKPFVLTWATSAAAAQVARLCAMVSAEYPTHWPETVRALVVHSAEWTSTMKQHLGDAAGKRARARLVRRYGFGVPSAERALHSATDALTLVVEGTIRPFAAGKMREMHLHDLPWPAEVLAGLGAAAVKLRVTLSYFVEPNPGRRGWRTRHRYQSHGLRFEVKRPGELPDDFRKRINRRALDEDEERPAAGSDNGWYLGEEARNRGSLHSDIWEGTAADLADRGMIAVFPVTGWWKELPKRDRSGLGARYALVVSIETPGVETDIWTPVAQEVGLEVRTAIYTLPA